MSASVAKMASALLTNPREDKRLFWKGEGSQARETHDHRSDDFGTHKVTKHAIFLDRESNVKKAVASSNLLPDVAIIDPMLTVSCPPPVTASAGIDAFLHAAEPIPFEDGKPYYRCNISGGDLHYQPVAGAGLRRRTGSGCPLLYVSGQPDVPGMVLNNSGTSLVHAMAYPVGGEHHTPHGVTLSALVVACFDYIRVSKQEKMVRLGRAMGEPVDGLPPRKLSPCPRCDPPLDPECGTSGLLERPEDHR